VRPLCTPLVFYSVIYVSTTRAFNFYFPLDVLARPLCTPPFFYSVYFSTTRAFHFPLARFSMFARV